MATVHALCTKFHPGWRRGSGEPQRPVARAPPPQKVRSPSEEEDEEDVCSGATKAEPKKGAQSKKDDKPVDPGCPDLLRPDLACLYEAAAPHSGYLNAARGLAARMAWGVGLPVGSTTGHFSDKHDKPMGADFLKATSLCVANGAIARAKLFGLRRIAEGSGISIADLISLHLFLTDSKFHDAVCTSWSILAAQQAPAQDTERAVELHGAHAQVSHAIRAVPSKKAVCYRVCRVQTPSGTCRELLQGHRHGLDKYQLGSIVMWRHAASATTNSNLAEELALRSEPSAGCGLIFKIRRSLGARPAAEFSEYPEHGEMIFAPGSIFRVVGLVPCLEHALSRGSAVSDSPWAVDVGWVAQHAENLSFDDACRARNILIVLDEETSGMLSKEGVGA